MTQVHNTLLEGQNNVPENVKYERIYRCKNQNCEEIQILSVRNKPLFYLF